MKKINISKLNHELDEERFNANYIVYRVEYTGKARFINYTALQELIRGVPGVDAIKADEGKRRNPRVVWVLSTKVNTIPISACCDDFKISRMNLRDIADSGRMNIVFVLLLSRLNRLPGTGSFESFLGDLFFYDPEYDRKTRKGASAGPCEWQISCLRVSIDSSFNLIPQVTTFSTVSALLLSGTLKAKKQKGDTDKKKTIYDYPWMIVKDAHFHRLQEYKDENHDNIYIRRQIDGKKASKAFLDIGSAERLENTKVAVLSRIIDVFNSRYEGMARLSFRDIPDTDISSFRLDSIIKRQASLQKHIRRVMSATGLCYIDDYSDTVTVADDKEDLVAAVIKHISNLAGVPMRRMKRPKPSSCNIQFLHTPEWYKNNEEEDRYIHTEKVALQHITDDALPEKTFRFGRETDPKKAVAMSVLNELLCKMCVLEKDISYLIDWEAEFGKRLIFAVPKVDEDEEGNSKFIDSAYFADVSADGTISFSEVQCSLFGQKSIFNDILHEMRKESESLDDVECAIADEDGNICIVFKTELYTVPSMERIQARLGNGIRSAEGRDDALDEMLDIKFVNVDGDTYYYVGYVGEGVATNFQNAVRLRRIRQSGTIPMEHLERLLSVPFVRNGRPTVVPFPAKLIRERFVK